MERLPDWQCPNTGCVNHTRMVFGSKASCPQCGSAKVDTPLQAFALKQDLIRPAPSFRPRMETQQMQIPFMQSDFGGNGNDWQCPNTECINNTKMVFGKHSSCPSCGTARNAKSPGDWLCPNPQCVNAKNCVFASKSNCPKCGMPKPAFGQGRRQQAQAKPSMSAAMSMMQPMVRYIPVPVSMGQGISMSGFNAMAMNGRANDWQCPNTECVNNRRMVFGKHDACPQCGSGKPGRGGANPGDWQCPSPECQNHKNFVFAKHEQCPRCGAARGGAIRQRSRSPFK
mmetsp:Transcript_26446/g.63084  ORF Transcript_26446/g.63084 Transcript_26446/m.63084 type:complete len:284 (-) Transcript_26446:54-905(-)